MTKDEARQFVLVDTARMVRSVLTDGGVNDFVRFGDILKADLPLVRRELVAAAFELLNRAGERACAFCACSETDPCEEGCAWAAAFVCTSPSCLKAFRTEKQSILGTIKKLTRKEARCGQ